MPPSSGDRRQAQLDYFDVGSQYATSYWPRQFATNPTVAAFIMDGIDLDAGAFLRIVCRWNIRSFRISRGLELAG